MPDRPERDPGSAALRRRAEERRRAQAASRSVPAPAPEDAAALLHELQVHQVELELQNDELRRTQEELELSRKRYFDLYDQAPIGYLTLNEAGVVLEANLTAAVLLGVARSALVSRPLTAHVFREDQDLWHLNFRELLRSGGSQVWELRLARAGAPPFWAHLEAVIAPGRRGGGRACLLTATDVTRRKEAEATRLESQRLLRLAQVVAGLGTYVLTFATGRWESSAVLDAIFGIDATYPRTVEGWAALIHPEERAATVAYFETEVVGRGRRFDREYRIVRPRDGGERWVHGYGDLDLGPAGDPTAMVGAILDVTDRKAAEARIRGLNAELELLVELRTGELGVANRELETFSYSVAHDLRAPLRAIEGFAAILAEECGTNLGEEGRRHIDVIRANAVKMGRLIDDLLAFSQTGRGAVGGARVSMGALARSAFEEVVGDPAARGRIDFTLGELPAVAGDAALLRVVWVNLLSNAVKFSARAEQSRIEVTGTRAGGRIEYRVRDNGVGFAMKHAGQLFGVFQQLHAAGEFEGTGIGLALVQRIVARHGGSVRAEGAPNAGATFTFSLPRKAAGG